MKTANLFLIVMIFGCGNQWASDEYLNLGNLSWEQKICVFVTPLIVPALFVVEPYFSDKSNYEPAEVAIKEIANIVNEKDTLIELQTELKELEDNKSEQFLESALEFTYKIKENMFIKNNCSYIDYLQEKGAKKIKREKSKTSRLFEKLENYKKSSIADTKLHTLMFDKKTISVSNLLYSAIQNCGYSIESHNKRSKPVKLDVLRRLKEAYINDPYLWVVTIVLTLPSALIILGKLPKPKQNVS